MDPDSPLITKPINPKPNVEIVTPTTSDNLLIVIGTLLSIILFLFWLLLLFTALTTQNDSTSSKKVLSETSEVSIKSPNKLVLPIANNDSRVINFNISYAYYTKITELREKESQIELLTDLKIDHPPFVTNPQTLVYFYNGPNQPSTPAALSDIKPGIQVRIVQFYIFKGNNYTIDTHWIIIDRSNGQLRNVSLVK